MFVLLIKRKDQYLLFLVEDIFEVKSRFLAHLNNHMASSLHCTDDLFFWMRSTQRENECNWFLDSCSFINLSILCIRRPRGLYHSHCRLSSVVNAAPFYWRFTPRLDANSRFTPRIILAES